MKKYIVVSMDGTCYDNSGIDWDNMQVIEIVSAPCKGAAIAAAWWRIDKEMKADYNFESLIAYELSEKERDL